MAVIQGRQLFKGDPYPNAALIRRRRLFKNGVYSRVALIRTNTGLYDVHLNPFFSSKKSNTCSDSVFLEWMTKHSSTFPVLLIFGTLLVPLAELILLLCLTFACWNSELDIPSFSFNSFLFKFSLSCKQTLSLNSWVSFDAANVSKDQLSIYRQ